LGSAATESSPSPFPQDVIVEFFDSLKARIRRAGYGQEEEGDASKAGNPRLSRWKQGPPRDWRSNDPTEDALLCFPTGNPLRTVNLNLLPWETPVTMRNVDASCELELNQAYVKEESIV
jgi:hypothetical protein